MSYTEKQFEEHIEEQLQSSGYQAVSPIEYDKALCLIPSQLLQFVQDTQSKTLKKLEIQYGSETESKLAKRISSQIETRGVIDVLRKGVTDRGCNFHLVYFQPKSGLNPDHQDLYKQNRLITVRQLKYSRQNENSIDMGIFINGIPIMMLELKNALTGQDHSDGIKQWKYDRDPKEPLFKFKRNLVYFALGNEKAFMTTRLSGSKTRFLPFNKGVDNPVNPSGHRTHYLWDDILQPNSVLDLIENFVHVREETDKIYDPKKQKVMDKKSDILIFPRFHQLSLIRRLKKAVVEEGAGHKYLVQHTTGSGKSLSIGWLSHLLSSLYQNVTDTDRIFDSVIVVTDRTVLDKQITNTIRQLEQTKGVVNAVEGTSQQLKEFLEQGKSIIITTIQKFPVISESIAKMKDRRFAVVIDEVHSSQSGESSKHLKKSLSDSSLDTYQEGEGDDDLTQVDKMILDEISARGMQPNISYFGFSGTPKNKTLEIFGTKTDTGRVAFDRYTMKQSIAEGFTLNVLQNYTTYKRYFKINKEIKEDKELPQSRVKSMLMNWVDLHPHTIREKTKIILEHFTEHTSNKVSGRSRAMLVTRSRLHCVKYKLEFDKQMKEMGLAYGALVGFSGSVYDQDTHQDYTEASMNGIPDNQTEESLKDPKYRLLIVNNKFQTGYDEPLLHTMYVDKKFGGLQCVQTLSRLNRTMSGKTDTFVLDFVNEPDEVQKSFQPYFEGTLLEGETDPNRLYAIAQDIDAFNLFQTHTVEQYVETFYLDDIPLEQLQGILDFVVDEWKKLEEAERETFRANIQSFIRLYGYISQIISFRDIGLEKLFIFLRGLNKKLPKRDREQLSDILSSIDLEYFKIEKKYSTSIELEAGPDPFGPIEDAPGGGVADEPVDFLSAIIQTLNDSFEGDFTEEDKVRIEKIRKQLHEDTDLRQVMHGDNTESNKREVFNSTFNNLLVGLVGESLDFYNKLSETKRNRFVQDRIFEKYSRSVAGG
jgi:type I restriction enzyme, R subunit